MAKPPALDLQLADLIEHVLACERLDVCRTASIAPTLAGHHCHLPGPGPQPGRRLDDELMGGE